MVASAFQMTTNKQDMEILQGKAAALDSAQTLAPHPGRIFPLNILFIKSSHDSKCQSSSLQFWKSAN